MEKNEAVKVIEKLHQEAAFFAAKKVKFKRYRKYSLIASAIFLIVFIVFLSIFFVNNEFPGAMVLVIVFLALFLVTIELAIVFHLFYKFVYAYKEENRLKIIKIITNEVTKKLNEKNPNNE
ncbi:MAG: hypothetical protein MJ208_02825 [Bacilli bacterium]|nr:hypothetical protein [Bacilli bacterium]